MNTYAEKRKSIPQSRPTTQGPEQVQPQLDAMSNIDVHSGHSVQLEDSLKSRIEQHLGYDLSGVEMRESADASAMGAEAFAKGNVVHFAPGHFDQHTEQGQHLIAHELSHVVQQAKGGVHADVDGFNVNASESLESAADHAGDSFVSGGHSSLAAPLASLPAMNADAAPVQGSFFGKIKDFFKKQKASFNFGRAVKKKDDAVDAVTAEHASTEAEMVKAMKAQGYTDEEIEAQKLFQRINMAGSREKGFQEAQINITDVGMALDDSSQMDNFAARLGRGTLTDAGRNDRAAREQNMLNNIFVGREELAQADEMADVLGAKYAKQNRALGELNRIDNVKDEGIAEYDAAYERYKNRTGKEYGSSNNVHAYRFLQRHLRGLDAATQDTIFDDMASNDKARMAPHIRAAMEQYMAGADASVNEESPDDDVLARGADQVILNYDNMSISDLISKGGFDAQTLGVTPEYFQNYTDRKFAHAPAATTARRKLKALSGQ